MVVLILPVFEGMSPTSIDTTVGDTRLYVGELVHSENPEARISAVQDGAGQMLVEIHNPTDKPMKCHLTGVNGYPPLAGVDCAVTVAPGSSEKRTLTCTPGSVVLAGF